MSNRLPTNRITKARVHRPPVAKDPLEDTDETLPVMPRTLTPVDESLAEVVRSLETNEDVAVPREFKLALEAISTRAREERLYLHRRLEEAEAERQPPRPPKPSRLVSLVKGAGVGSLIGGLVFAANFLVARGDAAATMRQRDEKLDRIGAQIEKLQSDTTSLRAQVAGHDAIIQVLAARLNAAPPHP